MNRCRPARPREEGIAVKRYPTSELHMYLHSNSAMSDRKILLRAPTASGQAVAARSNPFNSRHNSTPRYHAGDRNPRAR